MRIVLLHAFPLDERMWAPQLEALEGEDVYAPSLYDLGGNSVDGWAEHVLERVEGELVVVGASLGGYVALAMARTSPDRGACPAPRRVARDCGSTRAPPATRTDARGRAQGRDRRLEPRVLADRAWGQNDRGARQRDRSAPRPPRRDRGRHRVRRAARSGRRRPRRAAPGRRGARNSRVSPGRAGSKSSKALVTWSARTHPGASTRSCSGSCTRPADWNLLLLQEVAQHLGVRRRLGDLPPADAAAVVVVEAARAPPPPFSESSFSGSTHSGQLLFGVEVVEALRGASSAHVPRVGVATV